MTIIKREKLEIAFWKRVNKVPKKTNECKFNFRLN